ncbi:MAG: c-type cytochrome [Acidobacteria bacterium]|nr:c-type cytochrome [Acidobacteriota bacterium]
MSRQSALVVVLLAGWLISISARATSAQGSAPRNLQVLPKDLSRSDVVQRMREIATALGVRCDHCHVQQGEDFEYAADDKDTKRIARAMMRMTQEINSRLLPQIGRVPSVVVECATCHRGTPRPESLTNMLKETVTRTGVPAALQQYRELRGKHYGRGTYDFGAPPLNVVAEWLAGDRNDVDAAITVQSFNLEVNPDVATSYSLLAILYLQKGDKERARASFSKAIALDPTNEFYRSRLASIK